MAKKISPPISLVVLISGNGSNLQALIDHIESGYLKATIRCVISNRKDAYGLNRAQEADIPTKVIDNKDFPDRKSYDQALAKEINYYQPDLIILAGFMRILSPEFVHIFSGRMLNIHPSLLPNYKGLNTHQRVLEDAIAKDNGFKNAEHGCSIHFVSEDLDGGPIIAQSRVKIKSTDTTKTLAERVQQEEHRLYPFCIQLLAGGKIKYSDQGVFFNEERLPPRGLQIINSDYSRYQKQIT